MDGMCRAFYAADCLRQFNAPRSIFDDKCFKAVLAIIQRTNSGSWKVETKSFKGRCGAAAVLTVSGIVLALGQK